MSHAPGRTRAVAVFTLAAAVCAGLAGCSTKNAAPAANPATQAPSSQTNSAPQTASAAGPSTPAVPAPSTSAGPAPAPAPVQPPPTLPRGTRLQVRMSQTVDVKHVQAGDHFHGTLAQPVVDGNTVLVPAGSNAEGEILVAHRRGKFKGRSVMALTLTRLDVNGTEYRIDTTNLSRTKKGKGKRSAAFIGGGAGVGMLIGGIATGGVGLLVGGLAGGGAGALGAAFTGNRDISIPAETVITFRLQDSLTLAPVTQASLHEPSGGD
jgi:hypothetical protein